jgi:hypothetical protein
MIIVTVIIADAALAGINNMATDRGVRLAVAVQLCDYNET